MKIKSCLQTQNECLPNLQRTNWWFSFNTNIEQEKHTDVQIQVIPLDLKGIITTYIKTKWRAMRVYPKARIANDTALCHYVQLYRHSVSQSSGCCHQDPLYCFSTSVYCCKCIFHYRLSLETFGYTLVYKWYISGLTVTVFWPSWFSYRKCLS